MFYSQNSTSTFSQEPACVQIILINLKELTDEIEFNAISTTSFRYLIKKSRKYFTLNKKQDKRLKTNFDFQNSGPCFNNN